MNKYNSHFRVKLNMLQIVPWVSRQFFCLLNFFFLNLICFFSSFPFLICFDTFSGKNYFPNNIYYGVGNISEIISWVNKYRRPNHFLGADPISLGCTFLWTWDIHMGYMLDTYGVHTNMAATYPSPTCRIPAHAIHENGLAAVERPERLCDGNNIGRRCGDGKI